ncbi:hypothetical protein RBG61_02040 [Paludicola sp. MB14-C6]|uniref:hypothetical protein n=1 Tax=Paludihabitans sp. MB14-C6 TaxID=3070656 RepID=UPI0027DE22AD|nr:hypothetical protein [Paludicola sp. MB14-C6]WMJ23472.1 hypothetical protein RBG61_02040 [Paludicola sp. MB14-C6]
MHAYLVTYHLTKDILKYDSFFDCLNELSDNCNKELFDGCILIKSGWTTIAIREQLIKHIQPSDRLFVCKLNHKDIAGQLPDKSKQWIKEQIIDKAPSDLSDQLRK